MLPDRGQVTMEAPFLRVVRAAAHQDLPPPRRASRWAAWRRRFRSRTIPRRTMRAMDKVRADKLREVRRRPRRHLGGASGAGRRWPRRCSTRACRGPTSCDRLREDVAVSAAALLEPPTGTRTGDRAPSQHPRRHPVSRGVARRPGRGADLQPDGRCRHRGDLADADLAVAEASRGARRWPAR